MTFQGIKEDPSILGDPKVFKQKWVRYLWWRIIIFINKLIYGRIDHWSFSKTLKRECLKEYKWKFQYIRSEDLKHKSDLCTDDTDLLKMIPVEI